MNNDTEPVPWPFWKACTCYAWPVADPYSIGRCGRCGELADEEVDAPSSGKAEPLR